MKKKIVHQDKDRIGYAFLHSICILFRYIMYFELYKYKSCHVAFKSSAASNIKVSSLCSYSPLYLAYLHGLAILCQLSSRVKHLVRYIWVRWTPIKIVITVQQSDAICFFKIPKYSRSQYLTFIKIYYHRDRLYIFNFYLNSHFM